MRKLAPVFIAASVFAVSSSAFALGDKRDNRQAPSTSAATAPADLPSSYANPSTRVSSGAEGAVSSVAPKNATGASDATTLGSSTGTSAGTSGTALGASGSTSGTVGNGATSTDSSSNAASQGSAKAAAAGNDATKCDPARYASRTDMPKDCLDGKKGGAAVGSTQGQSGGDGAAGASGGAGSSGSSGGSSK